jgi:putative membrane fusion protein
VEKNRRRRERLQKQATGKKVRRSLGRLLLLVVGVAFICYLGYQLYLFCMVHAVRTQQARWDTLAVSNPARALVLRNETVVNRPGAGEVQRLVADGTIVSAGATVARLVPPSDLSKVTGVVNLTSPQPGFVCYEIDGWEGTLSPDRWQNLDLLNLFNQTKTKSTPDKNTTASAGPAFKIIDNLSNPILVLRIPSNKEPDFAVGDHLQLDWINAHEDARVVGVKNQKQALLVVVELLDGDAKLPFDRQFDITVTDQKCQGIILPAKAIVRSGKGTGVYLVTPAGIKLTKIEVICRLDDKVAVNGLVPGVEVVTNPNIAQKVAKQISDL